MALSLHDLECDVPQAFVRFDLLFWRKGHLGFRKS
jgi:hypothetical protein